MRVQRYEFSTNYQNFFVLLHPNLTIYMKFLVKHIGLGLIALGFLFLAALHLLHLNFINWLLLAALAIIVLGLVVHVWLLKRESRY